MRMLTLQMWNGIICYHYSNAFYASTGAKMMNKGKLVMKLLSARLQHFDGRTVGNKGQTQEMKRCLNLQK
jgi:hypothetical protein